MTWSEIETRWHDFVGHIRAHWPETDTDLLHSIAGDRGRLIEHLAAAHELTLQEAADALEDWMYLIAGRLIG